MNRKFKSKCWTWLHAKHPHGYGTVWFEGRLWKAHRLAWTLSIAPIPQGKVLRHRCNNPPCCNPAHLQLGTQLDNIKDMDRQGRRRVGIGERQRSAKLKAVWVPLIRAFCKWRPATEVGTFFGISGHQVGSIRSGKNWSHVC